VNSDNCFGLRGNRVLEKSLPMLAKLNTFALVGIDAVAVEVEVDAAPGLPKTVLSYPI